MTTKPRNIFPNNLYHVYNRATEKRKIFYTAKDYGKFLEKVFYYKYLTKIKILSYAVLPNHFHFLLEEPNIPTRRVGYPSGEKAIPAISKFMSMLSNSYTKYFNYNKNHSGRLFQGPFKSKLIKDDSQLQTLVIYINLNPVKHGLVKNINNWDYTSHFELLRTSRKNKLINQSTFIDADIYKKIIKNYSMKNSKNIDFDFD